MSRMKVIRWVAERVGRLIDDNFYGTMVLKFEKGKLVMLREERTEKPPRELFE